MRRREFLLTPAAAGLAWGVEPIAANWKARWIYPPEGEPTAYGVYHFRRAFDLAAPPARCPVAVSGDSRYRLFVNGRSVCTGPARGDLSHWRYEEVDLAPYLRAGRNVLAAVVWNDGPDAALCQWSFRTAFLVNAQAPEFESALNTGPGWKCYRNPAYAPQRIEPAVRSTGYFAIGPMERVDAARYPWGWEQPEFDDSSWPAAAPAMNASPREAVDAPSRWMLVKRPIPQMEETPQALADARLPLTVPAGGKQTLLLDQRFLTTAYPVLKVKGGARARVTLRYAEALFQSGGGRGRKGNRNQTEGKEFIGYGDTFILDGRERTFQTLYWRTWRYLQLEVEAASEPVTITEISGVYTGYPFARLATFDSGDALHQQILDVGWRTARLCAHETYMDCPYYEQLQYAGDTRIQCLVSLFMSGDARLPRNAIEQINSSRTPEGATYSRAPSVLQQYIPPFSLWWIGMVHDYMRYADDPAFVRSMLPGVRSVLDFYRGYRRADGLLAAMPWWNYVDWVDAWPRGVPPSEPDVMPATIHFQFLLALQYAAELETGHYSSAAAEEARALSALLRQKYWNGQIFSEDLAHQKFSQHANALAVLAGVTRGEEAATLMRRVEADRDLSPCTIYFRYYLNCALRQAGLGDLYLERLDLWKTMLNDGLTTWAEKDGPVSRSDCHAWGSSPNVELFRTVLGVDSAAPGFAKVIVRPHLGPLQKLRGTVPHPKGTISVDLDRTGGRLRADIKLPPGVTGDLEWGSLRGPIRPA